MSWLWFLPLVFVALFLDVRLNLLVQGTHKRIDTLEARGATLRFGVEERRRALAIGTDFSAVAPVAQVAGMAPLRGDQLLVLTREDAPSQAAVDRSGRVASGWVGKFARRLGPGTAQADDSRGGGRR